ncbi:MAG: hypothetical protein QME66_10565 [Candidatus Eisenbacteria bacterium]|nr:hypothetical protein [Candidatus Eisenbacteria bacterium]
MRQPFVAAAVAMALALLFFSYSEAKEKVSWVPDYDTALAMGKSEGKNILLLFYTDW